MSPDNVELVRSVMEAFAAGDLRAVTGGLMRRLEWFDSPERALAATGRREAG